MVQQLHRAALDGISAFAGNRRPADVEIKGSEHRPGGAHLVAEQVEEMCDYVNGNWDSLSPIHLAAYVLWRLNWIHPFDDGNGRTARMASYVVLCVRLGFQLPGRYTIPEQIAENKKPYYAALEAADKALKDGGIDVSRVEGLLTSMLAKQLVGIYERAKGAAAQDTATLRLH
jgi:Fic family protein